MRKTEYAGYPSGSTRKTRTPMTGPETIAERDNKIYSLATEASRLREKLDTKSTTKGEPFDVARMEGTHRAQEKYEYHIKNLENDKASLSKRLNIVLTELDKITAEKAEYDRQMVDQMKVSEELEEKIGKSENLSKVLNKNLQDDLKYEKELNDKLRDEVSRYEAQKSQLFVQLRENQSLAEQFERESRSLEESIKGKEYEISNLVEMSEKTRSQLKDAEDEVLELKRRLNTQDANIDQLTLEIQKVEDERNDLIGRMNDLTNKYEAYVSSMTQERDELGRTTKRHIKLLTAKILSEKLNLILKRQYYGAMSKLTSQLHEDSFKRHMTERLGLLCSKVVQRQLKSAFQKLYCTLLNWPNERERREQLLAHIVRDQSKRTAFASWMRSCRSKKESDQESSLGVTKLWQALDKIGKSAVEEAFLKLKRECAEENRRRMQLGRVVLMKYQKSLKLGFERLRSGASSVRQQIVFEYLANQLAEEQMEQVAFHKLKDAIRQSKIDKHVRLFRAFRYWKNAKRKRDQIKKASVIALKMEEFMNRRVERGTFHVLQQNRVESQLEALSGRLQDSVERHAELDNQLAATQNEQEAATKTLALKRVAAHLANRCYPYFEKWRRYVHYHYRGMNKLKVLIFTVYRNKLGSGFDLWRKESKRVAILEVSGSIDQAKEQIREMELEQLEKSNRRGEHDNRVKRKTLQKLMRNMELLDRQRMRFAVRTWNDNAQQVKHNEDLLARMSKRMRSFKLWQAFARYREQVREVHVADLHERRVLQLQAQFRDNYLRRRLAAWREYKNLRKRGKERVKRAIAEFERGQHNWAFQQWRRAARSIKIAEQLEEQSDLLVQEKQLKRNFDDLVEENSKLSRRLSDNKERIKRKYMNIMWNVAVRQKKLDRQSAFENWRFFTATVKSKVQRVKKVLREYFLAGRRSSFAKWLQIVRDRHLGEREKYLEEQKIKLKISKKKSQLELVNKVEEKGKAELLLENARRQAEKTHEISTRLIGHLIRKRDVNVYLPLQQAILRQWKEISDKERKLSEKLCSLARRHIFEHLFIRMKNETVREKEVEKCMRAFRKIAGLSEKSHVRSAFDQWKNFAYSHSNEEHVEKSYLKQQEIEGVESAIVKLNEKVYENGEMIVERRKREHVLHAWEKASSETRFMKDKAQAYARNRQYIRMKFAVQKWRNRTIATEKAKLQLAKTAAATDRKLLRRAFLAYRHHAKSQRSLPKALGRIANKFGMNNKIRGVAIVKAYGESYAQSERSTKTLATCRLSEAAERMFRSRIITHLGLLAGNSRIMRGRESKLARVVLSLYLTRARDSFRQLKGQTDKLQLVRNVEREGEPARTLERLNDEIEHMKDVLDQEGYEEHDFNERIRQFEDSKQGMLRRAIGRWLAFQRGDDNIVMAIDKWKKHAKVQAELREKLKGLCNYFERNPFKKGFQRWRNYVRNTKEAFKGVPKDDLVEECCSRGKRRAAMKDAVEGKRTQVVRAEEEERELARKDSSSKWLGLKFIQRVNTGCLEKAVHRWRSNINKTKIGLLRHNLDELAVHIQQVMGENDEFEDRNLALGKENEELRLLSMESIDLAKSMKDLNRQKEQLSVDLADRVSTIKKLLEDNRMLNEKLALAQSEAASGLVTAAQLRYMEDKD